MGVGDQDRLVEYFIEYVADRVAERVEARLAGNGGYISGAPPPYLNTEQAADYLGLSKQQLHTWRCHGEGPPYIKLGRLVRYRRADLDAFMLERMRQNTGQE
jgi:excisionase family DNA binding protein